MAVDKQYLKENNLEGVYNRMRQINEYVITNGHTREADDMQPDPNAAPAPEPMPQDGGAMPQGNEPMPPADPQGGEPMPDNGQMPPADPNGGMPQPAEPDPTIGAESPDTGIPEPEEGIEDVDIETAGPDDEVVDVDDLTNSQEASEYKIDGVNDKLSALLNIAGKFADAIADNDRKLNDLKAEFEKRNPTDTEKINIRSQNSQPFNVNPGEYWTSVREKNPNYDVISDNSVAPNEEDKLYTVTDDDLSNFNSADIEKSFSDFPKNLMDYFK